MASLTSPAPRRRLILATGVVMVGLALAGYATVADDYRHVGEFAGVSALLLGGVALIGDAFGVMKRWLALRWISAGVVLGAMLGTAFDATLAGFVAGFAIGIAVANFRAQATRSPAARR